MTPLEAAEELREELEEALSDIGGDSDVRVLSVDPPDDFGPDTTFRVTIELGGSSAPHELSTGLAIAFLADEEAAVDEFKRWVWEMWASHAGKSVGP